MATTAKRPKKPNPHTPVSNEPETAEAAPKKPASKPPSEGADAKAVKPKQDGSEAVEGFKLPKGTAEAMAETLGRRQPPICATSPRRPMGRRRRTSKPCTAPTIEYVSRLPASIHGVPTHRS